MSGPGQAVATLLRTLMGSLAAGCEPNKHKLCETAIFRRPTQRRDVVAYCNMENDDRERLETAGGGHVTNCMNTRVVLRLGNGQPGRLRGSRWQITKRTDGGSANAKSKETGRRKANF